MLSVKSKLCVSSTHSPVTVFLQQQKQASAARSSSRSRGMPMPRTKPRTRSKSLSCTWSLSATGQVKTSHDEHVTRGFVQVLVNDKSIRRMLLLIHLRMRALRLTLPLKTFLYGFSYIDLDSLLALEPLPA